MTKLPMSCQVTIGNGSVLFESVKTELFTIFETWTKLNQTKPEIKCISQKSNYKEYAFMPIIKGLHDMPESCS